jgi:sterol 3beta-glucosyltransferase
LPRLGKLYVSENYICFKSKLAGIRTKVIVPISDIYDLEMEKQGGVFHHGMVIVTKEQNDIFFEFYSSDLRNKCLELIAKQLRDKKSTLVVASSPSVSLSPSSSVSRRPNIAILDEIHRTDQHFIPALNDYDLLNLLPNSIKSKTILTHLSHHHHHTTSTPSTHPHITIKPLHITCLTIGSRGDVQPYIALCKGLQRHGHTTRIATHLEYKPWIESHGIEFREVKGDPAELMQCCVEYGMFTVQFLRESTAKFRGWVDELLESAWVACQETDVLIESPSAMAGVHIAEAMGIPFFGGFPMPWTRTRCYPHPFAVPERGLGGGYNYMTYVMMEQILWKGTCGQINRWRRNMLKRVSDLHNEVMLVPVFIFLSCYLPY